MKVCLAGLGTNDRIIERVLSHPPKYVLESFYYFKDWQVPLIKSTELFLLDSGAFTFMSSQKTKKVNFDEYLDRYIAFINENDVEYFFELDVDVVVGYDKVKQMRNRLDRETGKQCISVWHPSRGWDDFVEQTHERPYVALGGIVTSSPERRKKYERAFPNFIKEAHKSGAKIHGLGYTYTRKLKTYHFDSVDSTNWTSGGRFGMVYKFFNGEMKQKKNVQKRTHKRIKKALLDDLDFHNLTEWMKFQEYAEIYL